MKNKKATWINVLSIFIILFGLTTITAGGNAFFTQSGRIAAGKIIPLVLWYNFIAGFFYILAGFAIYKQKSMAIRISMLLANSSFAIYFALLIHIFKGNEYETRTLIAMTFRTFFWIAIATTTFRSRQIEPVECNC